MPVDQIAAFVGAAVVSVLSGAFLGGIVAGVARGARHDIGEVLADRINARNAQRVEALSVRLWRLKRGL